ncbi:hypothetical protein V2H45_17765 [Tumidithrix elongata RA019]|uniref:Barstar (barnase inhibitor) domain-containing protein n=1 Tax=Tumidithrix elongata BACA0141 TaxID=2716417 RepID=A0AAW9Q6M4_9CYAN|nr:hypothetical protein [Tumidithrix elongata RA019]
MTKFYQFAPEVCAFFSKDRDFAETLFQEKGLKTFWVDGKKCPTSKDFVEQLALAVQFPGEELSLNILSQELSNLDWFDAKKFGICISDADLLFASGNRYMWQYLLGMAQNIQSNVEDFNRPSISWLLQMEKSKIEELQEFFEQELGFVVQYLN